jgi:hypothetical protein
MVKVKAGKNQLKRLFQVRARIKRLQEIEESLANDAVLHIKTYGVLKQDEWSAMIYITSVRRPRWKEEFIKECGQVKADDVFANTKPTESEKLELYKNGVKVCA